MALHASTQWEIRNTGSQNNGGGFYDRTPGTSVDYSQQAAAQLTLTDLASTSASGWLTLTSATGGFTAAMVGNIICIASGTNFTAGWYEITAYTDTNTVTVDRACGATADASAGTGKVGGAFALGGTLDDDFFEAKAAGNIIWIASGSHSLGESVVIALAGTAIAPITIAGYLTTRGDNPEGTNRPLLTCAAYTFTVGAYYIVRNLRKTGTTYLGFGNYNVIENCKSQNSSATANLYAFYGGASGIVSLINCEAISDAGHGVGSGGGGNTIIMDCYIHDCGVTGIVVASAGSRIINNIIDSCTSIGVNVVSYASTEVIGNTIYNCATGISGTTASKCVFLNNIITNCTTGASWTTATLYNLWDYNCWNNTTDVSNVTKGDHDITADPLLNAPATGDFTLQSGSPCFNAGMTLGAKVGL